mgnify:CR=1 FL=1|jgi:putative glycosyltransferase (TIGR04372 family)
MGLFKRKQFVIFPLGKIAMYGFNLLPFVYYYVSKNCKFTVLILDHPFFEKRVKYGVINRPLLGIIKRSFDDNNIKYTNNVILIFLLMALSKIGIINIRKKSDARDDDEFYLNNSQTLSIMPQYLTCNQAFNRKKPFCTLSTKENKKGLDILLSNGVDISKNIVTFHVRDNLYHSDQNLDFRDSSVNELIPALDCLCKKNYSSFRMGSIQKSTQELNLPNSVINYTEEFRSEFMDIYLIEKSAFFIGSTSGLWGIPYLFNTPQVNINHIPFHDATLGENDIWLPKKLWLVDKKRYMNFREILSIPRAQMLQGDFYINNRIEVIDNTSDEILEAVLEMLDKIDGKLSYTAEDDYYWSKLKNMYSKDSPAKYSLSRISKSFLKKYSNLLV